MLTANRPAYVCWLELRYNECINCTDKTFCLLYADKMMNRAKGVRLALAAALLASLSTCSFAQGNA